mmetsp:Transcript_15510/g.47296  ORF Transcript_15510/g.47296 Transcript_15510/m.47296 type:complete len:220 (+) Transcript_15510:867-1526(+)
MALERVRALPGPEVPHLRGRVARARDEHVRIRAAHGHAHHIPRVVREALHVVRRLDVPEDACRVARGRQNLRIVHEPAARQVAIVRGQLPRRPHHVGLRQRVDGADVVQAAAGDKIAICAVGAGHDPGAAQRDGVDLVLRLPVPHDELAILRRRHKLLRVACPVHRVDLAEVPLELPPRHELLQDGAEVLAPGSLAHVPSWVSQCVSLGFPLCWGWRRG